MDILARITQLREIRSWSEYRLAEASGIQQTLIGRWYKEGIVPTITSLESICDAFGITLAQFFAGDELAVHLTKPQKDMLEGWSALSASKQTAVMQLINSLLEPD